MQNKDEITVLLEMIEKGESNGLLVASEETIAQVKNGEVTSNQYVRDLATHAYSLSQLWKLCNEIYENIKVSTASGEALDNFGRLLNVIRVPSSPAYVDFTVSVSAASLTDIVIPAGTRLLIEDVVPVGDYFTMESITLPAGVTSVTGRAESIDHSYGFIIPAGGVTGLEGFPELSVTNDADGTHGRDIEEDDVYRERIKSWASKRVRGSRALYEDYLLHYDGLDSFKLIPRYDGVGTMKIVCDTLESELDSIAAGVDANCKLETDYPTVCVLPESQTVSTLALSCVKGELGNLTESELTQIIVAQVQTFVEGGSTRSGSKYQGMSIGDDFYPSQLVQYLQTQVPEILNFSTSMAPVSVADLNKFHISEVTVSYV